MSKLNYTYLDYLYCEVGFTKEDIESVPFTGQADSFIEPIAKKEYVTEQFKLYSDAKLKEAVDILCDSPETKTRQENIQYIVWYAIMNIKERF